MNYKNIKRGTYTSINGKSYFMRSSWELKFACWLDNQLQKGKITDWEYEPEKFEFPTKANNHYTPDFKVHFPDNTHQWYEVKGFYPAKYKTKVKRFGKYFPSEFLELVNAEWFRDNLDEMQDALEKYEKNICYSGK